MNVQSPWNLNRDSKLGQFWDSTLGVPGKNVIQMQVRR